MWTFSMISVAESIVPVRMVEFATAMARRNPTFLIDILDVIANSVLQLTDRASWNLLIVFNK